MEAIRFPTQDGLSLEGVIRRPDGPVRGPALICHPHPLHGGSKDHPILWAIRNDLASRGFVVLAFNFRGVMGSEGSFGGGDDELADVWAAVERISQEASGSVFLAGWSFGANVGLRASMEDDRVGALALLGFPIYGSFHGRPPLPGEEDLVAFDRPVLFVSGENDEFSPPRELREFASHLPDASVEIVLGTDHYFPKVERHAAAIVGRFAEAELGRAEERKVGD
jgi:alpha/beta superfamily hydrolase